MKLLYKDIMETNSPFIISLLEIGQRMEASVGSLQHK